MKQLLKRRCSFQTPVSTALLLAFGGVFLCAAFHKLWLLFLFFGLSLLVNLWGHLTYIKAPEDSRSLSSSDRIVLWLSLILYGLMALSLGRSAIEYFIGKRFDLVSITVAVFALIFLALTLFETAFLRRMAPPKQELGRLWTRKRSALFALGGLCLLLILLNLEIFDTWFRWDSYEYYSYSERITFEMFTDLEMLRLANHAAYTCSLLYFFLGNLIGSHTVTVYLVNLLMLVCGTVIVWRICGKFSATKKLLPRLLVTCLYAFSPFTHGMTYSLALETFLAFGLLVFFWAQAEDSPAIATAAALLICFSKETGAVILACIMIVRVLMRWFDKGRKALPFYRRADLSLNLPILGVGLLWLYDYFTFNWVSSNAANNMGTVDGKPFNSFALSPTYIKDRLLSLIFTNFTWLLLLVVLVGFGAGLLRRKSRPSASAEERSFLWLVLTAVVASLIPTFLFITYNHIRYVAPTVILLILLVPFALDRLFSGTKLRSWICGLLVACSIGQCYFTIDPAMHLLYGNIEKGFGSLVFTDNSIIKQDTPHSQSICVSSQYNREIMYFDEALDDLIRQVGYDAHTCLVVSGEYMEPFIGGYVYSEYLIMGFGYPYTDPPRYIAIDKEGGGRYLSDNQQDRAFYTAAWHVEDIHEVTLWFDRVIYIQLPFRDQSFEDALLGSYTRTEIANAHCAGWELVAYEINIP